MHSRRAWSAALVVAVLTATSCGTRVTREDAAGVTAGATAEAPAGPDASPSSMGAPTLAGAQPGPAQAAPTVVAAGAGAPRAGGQSNLSTAGHLARPASPTGGGVRSEASDSVPGSNDRGGAIPTRQNPATSAAPTPTVITGPANRTPVLVANVGTYSGPAAATLKPNVDGVQLWVKSVNQRGGLNGHEVRILVYDDAGDPARHKAQVQEAVEQKKVLAFVGNAEALTGPSSSDYLAAKRIPVVGVDGGWDFPYQNPMYFLQVSSGTAFVSTFILSTAQLAVPMGKTKLGLLACAEAQACGDADKIFPERAKGLGLDLVYRGRASIAQPDFTAECLAARNAGVETFFVMMDGNSVSRIGNSCARQGFRPQYATASSIILDRFKNDPNLDGLFGSNQTFPYFQDETPGTAEFQQALRAFGGSLSLGSGVAVGWTAGKLLERAGAAMPEPPTTEAILRGLWSIRDDTLGGLTYPLTFTEGRPSERKLCWFNVQVTKGKWMSPDGYKLTCGT